MMVWRKIRSFLSGLMLQKERWCHWLLFEPYRRFTAHAQQL